MPQKALLTWLDLSTSKFHDWRKRYGKANEHNGQVPRDYWLEDWERRATIDFHLQNSLNGYRRLTFMMLDADVVAVSPSSTYRVLKSAGLLDGKNVKASKKGTGFKQPKKPHSHWHIDISYLNFGGTFYFLISVLDGRKTCGNTFRKEETCGNTFRKECIPQTEDLRKQTCGNTFRKKTCGKKRPAE